MNKLIWVLFTFLFLSKISLGGAFNALDANNPEILNYVAEQKEIRDLHLLLINSNKQHKSLPIKVVVLLNKDTLEEFLSIEGNYNKNVKTLFFNKGDSLKVKMSLIDTTGLIVYDVKGNLTLKESLNDNEKNNTDVLFGGEYWKKDEWIIFRYVPSKKAKKNGYIKFDLSPSFKYDKLYIQVNILRPDSNFVIEDHVLNVHEGAYLDFSSKELEVKLNENLYAKEGKFVIQVLLKNRVGLLNGVRRISLEVRKK